ncbi:MAG: UDP-N-acetylmuramoyl-tripeptide--D-alanyl-D-alanine ligase [Cycloclasticus sp. symbiont of Poecilosclerida sp. N]|nr:MAG: UDP-N-acetylmuramoyl-tripeptide--D-alanyl-D-alanine ligase [Cycloclasticus sp. symbiont of Poecilosclerida sp. N]
MQTMSLQRLASTVNGSLMGENVHFNAISTDTRSIKEGDLFVALQGKNFDANDFVDQADEKGAVAALVSADIAVDMPYVKVGDTLSALAALAKQQRELVGIPVVGITGSNGKTSVKEMLASILRQSNMVLATEGNSNNQIGVPLTLLKLTLEHDIAVVEMGASKRGDIAELCDIAQPTVVILNNVGAAHLEGFGDLQSVANTKGEIVSGLSKQGTAVLNRDEPWFNQWCEKLAGRKLVSFGASAKADVWADLDKANMAVVNGQFVTRFTLRYQENRLDIKLNMLGQHNVLNALAAASAAISLDISFDDIRDGLSKLPSVEGRMQPLVGVAGNMIINDCYNANPKSFEAAMSCLENIEQPVWVVLGDFAELGADCGKIHQQLGKSIVDSCVQRFYAVGENMKFAVNEFNKLSAPTHRQAIHFLNKEELSDNLLRELDAKVVVLIKASRSQGLESVVEKITVRSDG